MVVCVFVIDSQESFTFFGCKLFSGICFNTFLSHFVDCLFTIKRKVNFKPSEFLFAFVFKNFVSVSRQITSLIITLSVLSRGNHWLLWQLYSGFLKNIYFYSLFRYPYVIFFKVVLVHGIVPCFCSFLCIASFDQYLVCIHIFSLTRSIPIHVPDTFPFSYG